MKRFIYLLATDKIKKSILCSILQFILWVLSLLYSCTVRCISFCYDRKIFKSKKLPHPVISVGNIVLGGTGKTPVVEFIAKMLKSKGFKPAILTRGYMAKSKTSKESDEAKMLQEELKDVPVIIDPNRFRGASRFLKDNSVDVFIMDDGYQHRKLYRDLNIACVDSTSPYGNGNLIPRGILREPLNSISRSDLILLTKVNASRSKGKDFIKYLNNGSISAPIVEVSHKAVKFINIRLKSDVELSFVDAKNICCFCSIADPKYFEDTLIGLGANIRKSFQFMDHHIYKRKDLMQIKNYCKRHGIKTIVTTEKDSVKLDKFFDIFEDDISIVALRIEIFIEKGKDVFVDRILGVLSS